MDKFLASNFTLSDQVGAFHSLAQYRGRKVLLYFYPKDDTPGCTVEACSFRDRLNDFKAAGVQVLGVSADDVASHARFVEKFQLNFPLLADTEREVIGLYGVSKRESFLINEEGRVVRHFDTVVPEAHVEEVLAEVHSL